MDVKECEFNCSIHKCVECSEKRSEEYSEVHFAVAADHDGNKQMTCLLCKEQNSIRSGRFRRVGYILFKDVLDERLKLDELSKQEKKSKSKKSAPKRKVEAATSSTSKKRKSSDGANSERLADAGGPDDDKSCSDCCYHPGTGQWKLRIRKGKLMGADFHPYLPPYAASASASTTETKMRAATVTKAKATKVPTYKGSATAALQAVLAWRRGCRSGLLRPSQRHLLMPKLMSRRH
eukprot:scaffold7737_cov71-Skeletonema_dohrnii-CCMP3373.AAC.4